MTLFFGIFVALILINALLLIFSTSIRGGAVPSSETRKTTVPKSAFTAFKLSKSEFREAG